MEEPVRSRLALPLLVALAACAPATQGGAAGPQPFVATASPEVFAIAGELDGTLQERGGTVDVWISRGVLTRGAPRAPGDTAAYSTVSVRAQFRRSVGEGWRVVAQSDSALLLPRILPGARDSIAPVHLRMPRPKERELGRLLLLFELAADDPGIPTRYSPRFNTYLCARSATSADAQGSSVCTPQAPS
ncbi:MAG: hypothetical protein JO040_00275 [Gemmatimonadetes bacterium]|nr:hypothetical protein [Gemmatimonadota bacterium]